MTLTCWPPRRVLSGMVLLACVAAATGAEAHEGWGLVVQPDGTIYFADIPTNTIWRITPDGRLAVAVSDKHSHALVGGDDGSIIGTHEHTPERPGEVWKLAPDGALTTLLVGSRELGMSLQPFLIRPDGVMYSTNLYTGPEGPHRLLRRAPSGEVAVATADVRAIDGLALRSDSSIYFTDGASLRRLLASGAVVTIAEALTRPSWGEDLMGLEVDARGVAYVADYSGARVLKVDTDGLTSILFTSRWPWSPTGLARTSDAMVVLEHLRMPFVLLGNFGVGPYIRVLQVSADGSVTTRTTVWGRYSWALAGAVALGAAVAVAVRRRVTARRRAVSP